MPRDLKSRIERLEQTAGAADQDFRLFFEPRPCADPAAFVASCRARAAGASFTIVRFVKPGEVLALPAGEALQ